MLFLYFRTFAPRKKRKKMFSKLRPYMMPLAMVLGVLFHSHFQSFAVVLPYVIACLLFFPYCGISLRQLRPRRMHLVMLLVQMLGGVAAYCLLRVADEALAQAVLICLLAPTASAAVVITGMLGGNLASVTTYTLLSNFAVMLAAPLLFSWIGAYGEEPFIESFWLIFKRISLVLLLPFVSAVLLRKLSPRSAKFVAGRVSVSFYLWVGSLVIATATTVNSVMLYSQAGVWRPVAIACLALLACVGQFGVGKYIGRNYGDAISAGQSLGQKNTIFAIWLAQSYLLPISAVAPGAYILWQNLFNSLQIFYTHRKRRGM